MMRLESTHQHVPAPEAPHVLFLIDELCTLGGAERALLRTLRLLPKDRFRCSLATFRINPSLEALHRLPCDLHVFPLRRTYDVNALRMALRLRNLIRHEKVKIVHTFFETSDLWGGPIAKLSGCAALVSNRRDMGILRLSKHQFAYRVMNPLFDHVLTVSEEVRSYCIQHDRLNPEKVTTLYTGIEMENVLAADGTNGLRVTLGVADDSPLIITVANIRRVKGLDTLLRAAAAVRQEFPRAVFLLVGGISESPHYQELQDLAASLGLKENVRFLGARDDVISLLKISDVFCLPSRSEGFSNALLEAMARGLPCVATRVGGNAEAVEEGRNGFLVPHEDPDALADRILTLLRQPSLAKQMGQVGRQIVEAKFTADAMIARLVELYDSLLDRKRS